MRRVPVEGSGMRRPRRWPPPCSGRGRRHRLSSSQPPRLPSLRSGRLPSHQPMAVPPARCPRSWPAGLQPARAQ
eukprot:scaffold152536_cov30-Tisochrysis_lutea.AAC.6